MTATTLQVAALHKQYGRRVTVDAVSFDVHCGTIHGLLGPNGSGKTTTLHIVTGLIEADDGQVTIAGISIADKESRRAFGFAPDDLPLPTVLSGREFLVLNDSLRGRDDRGRAALLADALDLEAELDKLIAEYSHGMQRKLQLIAAIMHNPRLVILDEPFRGLDPEASATVRALLNSFVEGGGAVLVATHDMLRAERDCHSVSVLSGGKVVAQGSPASLMRAHEGCASLEEVFMRVTGRDIDLEHKANNVRSAFVSSGTPPPHEMKNR
jgi:ABC-2 type transport system ATP-binding protein